MSTDEKRGRTVSHARQVMATLRAWLPAMEWRPEVPPETTFATAAVVMEANGASTSAVRALQQAAVLCHCHAVTWADIDGGV